MILLAFLAAASVPQPGVVHNFDDWVVGCDNGKACHALAMLPTGRSEEGRTMSLRRGPEADARPTITIHRVEGAPAALVADGNPLAVRLVREGEDVRVEPENMETFISTLRDGQQLSLRNADGTAGQTITLEGAFGAMLYMDEAQGRLDTSTALIRVGRLGPDTVPPPPPLPQIRLAPAPAGPALTLTRARIVALRREAGCEISEVGGPDSFEAVAIDPARTLILLACGTGAYNLTSIPFVAERRGGDIHVELARFDIQPGWFEDGNPSLVNAVWDPAKRLLSSFSRARGLGDCGEQEDYAWDGERFRLAERRGMPECQGATNFIATWRAEIVQS